MTTSPVPSPTSWPTRGLSGESTSPRRRRCACSLLTPHSTTWRTCTSSSPPSWTRSSLPDRGPEPAASTTLSGPSAVSSNRSFVCSLENCVCGRAETPLADFYQLVQNNIFFDRSFDCEIELRPLHMGLSVSGLKAVRTKRVAYRPYLEILRVHTVVRDYLDRDVIRFVGGFVRHWSVPPKQERRAHCDLALIVLVSPLELAQDVHSQPFEAVLRSS